MKNVLILDELSEVLRACYFFKRIWVSGVSCVPWLRVDQNGMPARPFSFLENETLFLPLLSTYDLYVGAN